MRKLQTQDVFATMRAIKRANLKEGIKPIIMKVSNEGLALEDAGLEGILGLIEIFAEKKSEQAIYEVLAGPFETTAEEIETMDLIILVENLEKLSKENDLQRFFTLLAGLITKKQ